MIVNKPKHPVLIILLLPFVCGVFSIVLRCKYTTVKSPCQEFLLNIFTKNFRKKSKRLTINELAQQRPRKFLRCKVAA